MKPIKMNYVDFIKEHKHLIHVLKSGSKSERITEASKQLKELYHKLK